ncbi:hypothetical protein CROQUDRAFT_100817 [Cronartium quercuum f. sp. fusiforme G11]|uniref:Secreted protein n=1 Tax=Cronartium quercuum f. sp. fusiforme G11 TaxID=708437 RepID=A0A9P6T701_9BASI|nr:hypothetical protein CROQUDRAFT_100817 [Cronartium quercuum f. sp. fusiforme G11]
MKFVTITSSFLATLLIVEATEKSASDTDNSQPVADFNPQSNQTQGHFDVSINQTLEHSESSSTNTLFKSQFGSNERNSSDVSESSTSQKAEDFKSQQPNTLCYNFFLQKDGCVNSSAENPCNGTTTFQKTASLVGSFEVAPKKRLARRYDTTIPTQAVGGGDGICGPYDTNTTSGVCLWSGSDWVDGSNPATAGWLNGAETSNCRKLVYIQRANQPETVQVVPVLDGCYFGAKKPEVGCFQVWMTSNLFNKFNPTDEERANLIFNGNFTWDFDSLDSQKPENAPI